MHLKKTRRNKTTTTTTKSISTIAEKLCFSIRVYTTLSSFDDNTHDVILNYLIYCCCSCPVQNYHTMYVPFLFYFSRLQINRIRCTRFFLSIQFNVSFIMVFSSSFFRISQELATKLHKYTIFKTKTLNFQSIFLFAFRVFSRLRRYKKHSFFLLLETTEVNVLCVFLVCDFWVEVFVCFFLAPLYKQTAKSELKTVSINAFKFE